VFSAQISSVLLQVFIRYSQNAAVTQDRGRNYSINDIDLISAVLPATPKPPVSDDLD